METGWLRNWLDLELLCSYSYLALRLMTCTLTQKHKAHKKNWKDTYFLKRTWDVFEKLWGFTWCLQDRRMTPHVPREKPLRREVSVYSSDSIKLCVCVFNSPSNSGGLRYSSPCPFGSHCWPPQPPEGSPPLRPCVFVLHTPFWTLFYTASLHPQLLLLFYLPFSSQSFLHLIVLYEFPRAAVTKGLRTTDKYPGGWKSETKAWAGPRALQGL